MSFTDKQRLEIIGEWEAAQPGTRSRVAKNYGLAGPTVVRWKRMFSKKWRLGKVRQ